MKEGGLRGRVGRCAGREDLIVEREPRFQSGGGAGVEGRLYCGSLSTEKLAPDAF